MNINLRRRVSVLDLKTGRVIKRGRWVKSRSFVKNFMVILQAQFTQNGSVDQVRDISDTYYNVLPFATNLSAKMLAEDITQGIVFGKGTGAVLMLSWKLTDRYGHGTGANQLNYNIGTFAPLDVSTSKTYQLLSRTATNTGIVDKTVTEVGIHVRYRTTTGLAGEALIVKDLISPIILEPGETIQVQYEISIEL